MAVPAEPSGKELRQEASAAPAEPSGNELWQGGRALPDIKVSVIIPTHNSEKSLERALRSVRSQTAGCEVEILLCDDHSDDQDWLGMTARQYDCRLLHVTGRGGGPNFGRNLGIRSATGSLIAFLDHDDEWLPDKLEIQIKEILNGAEFVYSPAIVRKV